MSDDYGEIEIFEAGKRCGIRRAEWMGDWFMSWSPRNDNEYAEGQWAHWVNLAKFILSHPATEIVDRGAFSPNLKADPEMYTEGKQLTQEQIQTFFPID
jgi:hypothetical protein